ncbi:hypothetical protein LSM04_008443 [Trypanosoma melophagium]|uniref:uncharacterized protein n=1 Tax=Trypanosoma melophagium TaxID=715481 RepID=UPI00351A7EC3|nr:hypothetical protein LSM04_008443 [Trypanosoma melophagium]
MEGNFYISDTVIQRELQSRYGRCFTQCREEVNAYGRCVEAGQINRNLTQGLCSNERRALRACVEAHGKKIKEAAREKR